MCKQFGWYFLLLLCFPISIQAQYRQMFYSPDKQISISISLNEQGILTYALQHSGTTVIQPSSLGLQFKEPALRLDRFIMESADTATMNSTWEPVWGESARITDHHTSITLHLKLAGDNPVKLLVDMRLYNDGLAFRYRIPEQKNLSHFVLDDEFSQFSIPGNPMAFWIPGDYDTNEYPYNHTRLSDIDATLGKSFQEIAVKTPFHPTAVQTPLMMKTDDGFYINIHEAGLRNYPAMNLVYNKDKKQFQSALVPDAVGNKAYLQAPAHTPWRTIIVGKTAAAILSSRIILNCNEPSVIKDPSFIKPQKMVGVWWEMHVGKSSWDYSGGQVGSSQGTRVPHGANTANVKRYIDFAAQYGFDGVLVEGWNTGWEDWFGKWKEDVFDFQTPYPDYDLPGLAAYAREKKVRLIMHHETSGSVTNYERHMEKAYALMEKYGMNTVKTGYVGKIIPRGEHHDGQWMVNHYERVAKALAAQGMMADMHEPVRPTGLHRTYPNWLANEAARGNEFNAWSSGNPPEHETILPFTRLMGGPMDYTPGIFKIKMSHYQPGKKEQVHTTLCKQLALYVTMYSPLQMAADLPENYEARPDAFQFIRDVAVDWDETHILWAEPGDYLGIARRQKNSANWFIGGITDEQARTMKVDFSFLPAGKTFAVTLYRDADAAHWKDNPEAYTIEKFLIRKQDAIQVAMAAGGGFTMSLVPAGVDDQKKLKLRSSK